MDQQMKLRPKKNPAQPKTRKHSHLAGTARSPTGSNPQPISAPISNEQSAQAPSAESEHASSVIVTDGQNNGNENSDTPAAAVVGAASQEVIDLDPPILPASLETFFKKATERFEKMIRSAVDSFITKLDDLEANLGASLEFERKRVDELESKQGAMEKQINDMQIEMNRLKAEVEVQSIAANRNERFSRRNNVRLIGIPEPKEGERDDCIQVAEKILKEKFNINSKVERSHRDGRKNEGKPRHILVKLLSYRDKVDVMRRTRDVLKDERYFITDDLTPLDLKEKQTWVNQVQELYKAGT